MILLVKELVKPFDCLRGGRGLAGGFLGLWGTGGRDGLRGAACSWVPWGAVISWVPWDDMQVADLTLRGGLVGLGLGLRVGLTDGE